MSVYVWTAPGPYVSGGLPHILLQVVSGCFHPEQKAPVSDRDPTLLAAEVAVAGAHGKARSSSGYPRSSRFRRVSTVLSRRPAGLTYVLGEVTVAQ